MEKKIVEVQAYLEEMDMDGWLLYDFQKRNSLMMEFLQIPSSSHLTRRVFYWIPRKGEPVKIVHAAEAHLFECYRGKTLLYFQRSTLAKHLEEILQGRKRVAMEYSQKGHIPAISLVDAGTVDWIRSFGVEVVSSGGFVQAFTCVLSQWQRKTHLEAAFVLEETARATWKFLFTSLLQKKRVTEWDVRQKMEREIAKRGCEWEGPLICAVNANSSNPHYAPTEQEHQEIRLGDWILIDLWCKQTKERSVYADISQVGFAGTNPSSRHQEVFAAVRLAQEKATKLVEKRFSEKKPLLGYEVDLAARSCIEKAGFGEYFIHRTGHNIYIQDHGPGTHMDSLETFDDRPVLAGTCFSIEPGIYLPGEFGVRLEYDVYVTPDLQVQISGGVQEEILLLS